MKTTFDSTARAGYIQFSEQKAAQTIPVNDQILCDLDASGMLCGVEFLNISAETLESLKNNATKSLQFA